MEARTQTVKKLVVDMDYDQPKFTFNGEWCGKDIIILRNLVRREYLRHQQLRRREAIALSNE